MRQRWVKWFAQRPSVHRLCTQPWHHFAFLLFWEAPHFSSRFASLWIPYILELLDMFCFPQERYQIWIYLQARWGEGPNSCPFGVCWKRKIWFRPSVVLLTPTSTQLSKAWVGLRCCCYPSWAFWDEGNETEEYLIHGNLVPKLHPFLLQYLWSFSLLCLSRRST